MQLAAETGEEGCLSVLPGASDLATCGANVAAIIWSNVKRVFMPEALEARVENMKALGEKKVDRFKKYMKVFPELLGSAVFIGDDGQGKSMGLWGAVRVFDVFVLSSE